MINPKIFEDVAKELELPVSVVENTYKAFWTFIRDNIEALPLKEDITEDEFKKLKTNFNIPSLGKLACSYEHMLSVKRKHQYLMDLKKKENAENNKDKASV
jgi:hypothetical protein